MVSRKEPPASLCSGADIFRADRKKDLEKSHAVAIKKRNDNIAARNESKKNKKKGIKNKDKGKPKGKGRPGFEGGKKGKGKGPGAGKGAGGDKK